MYCKHCGKELPEGSVICSACQPGQGDETVNVHPIFRFDKVKGFSYLQYKDVETSATLLPEAVEITSKTTWFMLFKRPAKTTVIPYAQITDITNCRTWDFWDLAMAAFITLASGMSRWYWWVLVLAFVWTAAGHRIEIVQAGGGKGRILYSALTAQNEFVELL